MVGKLLTVPIWESQKIWNPLLIFIVLKISRGSQIFLYASLAQTPTNFGSKSCFLVNYSRDPSWVPNLKLLASMVAEINRGPKFLDAALAQTPINFGHKSCFW